MKFRAFFLAVVFAHLLTTYASACERPMPEDAMGEEEARLRFAELDVAISKNDAVRDYTSICQFAIVALEAGNVQIAQRLFIEASDLALNSSDSIRAVLEAADIARDRGEYIRAKDFLLTAQAKAEGNDDVDVRNDILNRLGSASYNAGDLTAAIKYARESQQNLRALAAEEPTAVRRLNLARQLNALATYLREDGQIDSAISALNESDRVFQTIPASERGSMDVLNLVLLARLEGDQGNHALAADLIARASLGRMRLRPGYPQLYPLFSGAENAAVLRDPELHDKYVREIREAYSSQSEKSDLSTLYFKIYELQGHVLAGRTEDAMTDFMPVLQLHEDFYGQSRAEEIAKLEADYQKAERESEIAALSLKAELDGARLRNQRLTLWITILTGLAMLTGVSIILWRRNTRGRLEATVTERTRIARELHDTLVQDFTGTTLKMQRALNQIGSHPDQAASILAGALEETDTALEAARMAILDQRAPTERTLSAVLQTAVDKHAANSNIAIRSDIRHFPDSSTVPARTLIEVGVIVEELLRNAVQHSGASQISVGLQNHDQALHVTVTDNGVGFDVNKNVPGHYGLIGIEERAREINSKFRILSSAEEGTQATLSFPSSA